MTDLDAAGYIRELMEYNVRGEMQTPANTNFDTFFHGAMEHALRALEERAGAEGKVYYDRLPNGAYTASVTPRGEKAMSNAPMFDHEHMYTYIKGYTAAMNWDDATRALAFARTAHKEQFRKSGEPYIIHPLTVASHALAIGIKDEAVVATALLHDVCEDCDVDVDELPVNAKIREAVRLVTHMKPDPLKGYYREIAKNPVASLVKLLDRCDNVSTMAGVFQPAKLLDYVKETHEYVMPLWRETKDKWPQYSSALFVIKYHILSVINGLEKYVTANKENKDTV